MNNHMYKRPIWTSLLLITFSLSSCFGEDKMISTKFDLTGTDLKEIISDQPEDIQKKILDNPARFLELADSILNLPEELFYLADKKHPLTRDQAPKNLVSPFDYDIAVSRKDRLISPLVIDQLKKMSDQARKEGLVLLFSSGYRPYDYQEMLFNRYVEQMGEEEASRVSARPGTSQHQLGTAMDFGSITDEYADTAEGKWLAAHAGNFGFSLSYPDGYEHITGYKWECWHYRYISIEGIQMQREFFNDIQQYLMEFWHYHKDQLSEAIR